MYKGTNDWDKKRFEEYNKTSDFFKFSLADLEANYNKENVYEVYSSELREKLWEVICQQKKESENISRPTSIRFLTSEYFPRNNFPNNSQGYCLFFEVSKKGIYELAKNGHNGIITFTSQGDIFSPWKKAKLIYKKSSLSETKNLEINQIRASVLIHITQALTNSALDLSELGAEYFFLKPEYCLCLDNPHSEDFKKWHRHHINVCLSRPEKINSFKNEIISLIQQNKVRFDKKKVQIWQEIQTHAQSKNLQEVDFNPYKDQIYQQTNSEDLANKKQMILIEIADLANSASEAEQETKQKKFREQAEQEQKKKEEKQNKEKEEQEQKEKQEREHQEQQAKKQEEFKKHLAEEKKKAQGDEGKSNNQPDNSTQNPTNQEKEKNNSPTQQQPLVNLQVIEQSENVQEIITNIKSQIQQVLKKNNLQISDLSPKYHNWEKQLAQLTTKDQITALVQAINHQIEQKLKELKQSQKHQKQTNNDQPFSLAGKILIGGGVIILISFFFLILVKRIRRK